MIILKTKTPLSSWHPARVVGVLRTCYRGHSNDRTCFTCIQITGHATQAIQMTGHATQAIQMTGHATQAIQR